MDLPKTTLDKETKLKDHNPKDFHGTKKIILTRSGKENETQEKINNKRQSYLDAKKVIYAAT